MYSLTRSILRSLCVDENVKAALITETGSLVVNHIKGLVVPLTEVTRILSLSLRHLTAKSETLMKQKTI